METYYTFGNLYKAYLDCKKRKSNTLNHIKFWENLEENLLDLEEKLQNRTYKPGRSIAFVVQKPKLREVFAADFRDRVVHHLLCNYLSPIFERTFIYDSWACRKGKGTHGAMLRLREFARKLSRERDGEWHQRNIVRGLLPENYRTNSSQPARVGFEQYRSRSQATRTQQSFYLKMDIKSFFMSIDQRILYNLIAKRIKKQEILWLVRVIIFHDCARDIPPKIQSQPCLFDKLPVGKSLFKTKKGKGLPIGNLTSQFFANVYLGELDQFIKHKLKLQFTRHLRGGRRDSSEVKEASVNCITSNYYLRYVDDFVLLGNSITELKYYRDEITRFVADKLFLTVHPKKQIIKTISSGIDFVGYIVRSDYVLIRRRVIGDFKRRLEFSVDKESAYNSFLAYAQWANSHCLLTKLFYRFCPYVSALSP